MVHTSALMQAMGGGCFRDDLVFLASDANR